MSSARTSVGVLVLSHCASETVFHLAKLSLGWLREILEQELVFQVRKVVPKAEVGEVTQMGDGDGRTVVYGNPPSVKQSRLD